MQLLVGGILSRGHSSVTDWPETDAVQRPAAARVLPVKPVQTYRPAVPQPFHLRGVADSEIDPEIDPELTQTLTSKLT